MRYPPPIPEHTFPYPTHLYVVAEQHADELLSAQEARGPRHGIRAFQDARYFNLSNVVLPIEYYCYGNCCCYKLGIYIYIYIHKENSQNVLGLLLS